MGLSKSEKKALKAQAQGIKAKVMVGKNGLGEGTFSSIDEVLIADEICKVKFLGDDVVLDTAFCENIAARANAEFVTQIGHVVVLYRKKL